MPDDVGQAASRAVLGRGLLYTVGTAVPVLSLGAITPFTTRLLGPTEYGVVAAAMVGIQVAMMLLGLGLAASITRHGILEKSGLAGAKALVRWGTVLSLGLGLLAAAFCAGLADLAGLGRADVVAYTVLSGASFAIVVNVQAFLRIQDRPLPFVLLAIGASACGPVLAIVLSELIEASASVFLVGILIGYAATAVAALALSSHGAKGQPGDLRLALRIGLPTIPHQVSLYLSTGAIILIAGSEFGTDAAGRLQLGILVGTVPAVITASLNNAWAPVVYRTDPAQRHGVLERTSRDIATLTGLCAGGVALLAPIVLIVLAPAEFAPTALTPAVGLSAMGSVLSVAYLANVHLVFASGRSGGLAVLSPAALAVGLVAAWLLGRAFGLAAMGAGVAVTYAVLALGVALLARRVSATRWREPTMAPGLALGLALCALGAGLPTDGGWLLARVVAAFVLAGLTLRLLREVIR